MRLLVTLPVAPDMYLVTACTLLAGERDLMNSTRSIYLTLGGLLLAGRVTLGTSGCATGTSSLDSPVASGVEVDAVTVGGMTPGGTTILAMASTGSSVFSIGRNGTDLRFAASFDGRDPDENWEALGVPVDVVSDGFTIVNPGNSPDAAPGGVAHVAGQAGTDIVSLEIITDDGSTVSASIADGFYVAAWEGADFSDRDTLDQTFVLTRADGSSTTISYLEMTEG